MARLFVLLGLAMAAFGVVSQITMSHRLQNDQGGMAAFGLALNVVVFIIPGRPIASVAAIVVWRRTRRAKRVGRQLRRA